MPSPFPDPLTPETRAAIERTLKQVAEITKNLPSEQMLRNMAQMQETLSRAVIDSGALKAQEVLSRAIIDSGLLKVLDDQQRQIQGFLKTFQAIDPATLARFQRLLDESRAPNWPSGRDNDVIDLIEKTGWPLVWVPDSNLVEMLLAAEDSKRDALLVDHSDALLAACTVRLDEIPAKFLPDCTEAVRQSITAFAAAPMASQSLAATTFEAILLTALGYPTLNAATKDLTSSASWEDESFRIMRWALIRSCLPDVLTQFWADRGDPVPTKFNRHASVHALGSDQYTLTNALVGILMNTAALRELHQLDVDGLL